LLARWDQTEPELQREIVAEFAARSLQLEKQLAEQVQETRETEAEVTRLTDAYDNMRRQLDEAREEIRMSVPLYTGETPGVTHMQRIEDLEAENKRLKEAMVDPDAYVKMHPKKVRRIYGTIEND